MVSPNVDALAGTFEDIVEDQDIAGGATLALAGAGGGVLAQQVANRVLPVVGMSAMPQDTTGLAASGVTKLGVAAIHGFLAREVGGTPGAILALGGLGAGVVAGGDLVSAILQATGSSSQQIRRMTGNRSRSTTRRVSASSTRSSSSDSSSRSQQQYGQGSARTKATA